MGTIEIGITEFHCIGDGQLHKHVRVLIVHQGKIELFHGEDCQLDIQRVQVVDGESMEPTPIMQWKGGQGGSDGAIQGQGVIGSTDGPGAKGGGAKGGDDDSGPIQNTRGFMCSDE